MSGAILRAKQRSNLASNVRLESLLQSEDAWLGGLHHLHDHLKFLWKMKIAAEASGEEEKTAYLAHNFGGGIVYFLRTSAGIKVGCTDGTLIERMASIQGMCPLVLDCVSWVYPRYDAASVERMIHGWLADYRLHHEWFATDCWDDLSSVAKEMEEVQAGSVMLTIDPRAPKPQIEWPEVESLYDVTDFKLMRLARYYHFMLDKATPEVLAFAA